MRFWGLFCCGLLAATMANASQLFGPGNLIYQDVDRLSFTERDPSGRVVRLIPAPPTVGFAWSPWQTVQKGQTLFVREVGGNLWSYQARTGRWSPSTLRLEFDDYLLPLEEDRLLVIRSSREWLELVPSRNQMRTVRRNVSTETFGLKANGELWAVENRRLTQVDPRTFRVVRRLPVPLTLFPMDRMIELENDEWLVLDAFIYYRMSATGQTLGQVPIGGQPVHKLLDGRFAQINSGIRIFRSDFSFEQELSANSPGAMAVVSAGALPATLVFETPALVGGTSGQARLYYNAPAIADRRATFVASRPAIQVSPITVRRGEMSGSAPFTTQPVSQPTVVTVQGGSARETVTLLPNHFQAIRVEGLVVATDQLDVELDFSGTQPAGTAEIWSDRSSRPERVEVTVPAGVRTVRQRWTFRESLTLFARFGEITRSLAVPVLPYPRLRAFRTYPPIYGDQNYPVTLFLNGPAPRRGLRLDFFSSLHSIPRSVRFGAGRTQADVTLYAPFQAANVTDEVWVSNDEDRFFFAFLRIPITKTPDLYRVRAVPARLWGGLAGEAIIEWPRGGGPAVPFRVKSDGPQLAVPAQVVLPQNATQVSFDFTTLPVAVSTVRIISVEHNGFVRTTAVTLTP